jgi:serine/threonine protein phosphatase PrpC
MFCPACGLDQPEGHRFCEDCGVPLHGPCVRRADPAREHLVEAVSPRLAGVSDRGKRYRYNDDFFSLLSEERGEVLVVCDGVSCSQTPDVASAAAACATREALRRVLADGRSIELPELESALLAAEVAVRALPFEKSDDRDPPETTIVVTVRQGRRLTVGWLGDSRAYLVTPAGARQLTEDHSWINEVVTAGTMTRAEARKEPLAHAITRTLGGRTSGDEPALRTIDVPAGPALLMLCTDGLWNYLPEPWYLAELIRKTPPGADALTVSRALITHALDHEAHDNVTAAVLILEERRS